MSGYVDHAASTTVRPSSLDAYLKTCSDLPGNPSGAHRAARRARQALDGAREVVAAFVGGHPGEVTFTSGGTEADNLALFGIGGGTVVVSAVEHPAVLEPAARRGGALAPVDRFGRVEADRLASLVGAETGLVSVMAVNNETGAVQPLAALAEAVHRANPTTRFHTDAVQAAPWLDLSGLLAVVDAVTLSGHKLGAPKGIGALVTRRGLKVAPSLFGGGQERERRAGTQNVAGAVALAAALIEIREGRDAEVARIRSLRRALSDGLASIAGVVRTLEGLPEADRAAGIEHICVPGVDSEALVFLLDQADIATSAASSCASGAQQRSHVLAAMGVPAHVANGSLRFSLGWSSTPGEVAAALAALAEAVAQLGRRAPRAFADGAR